VTREMTGRDICKRCRHPRPLHSNGMSGCKARGCHSGPDEQACQGFMSGAGEEIQVAVASHGTHGRYATALDFDFRAPEAAAG
jgi:hypothetical protein